nr:translation initiation factor IF-2-like [Symphalangus syndactylus]
MAFLVLRKKKISWNSRTSQAPDLTRGSGAARRTARAAPAPRRGRSRSGLAAPPTGSEPLSQHCHPGEAPAGRGGPAGAAPSLRARRSRLPSPPAPEVAPAGRPWFCAPPKAPRPQIPITRRSHPHSADGETEVQRRSLMHPRHEEESVGSRGPPSPVLVSLRLGALQSIVNRSASKSA